MLGYSCDCGEDECCEEEFCVKLHCGSPWVEGVVVCLLCFAVDVFCFSGWLGGCRLGGCWLGGR